MNNKKLDWQIKKIAVKILGDMGLKEKIIKPPSIESNVPFVYYAFLDKIENINSIDDVTDSVELPNSVIINPGIFKFYGKIYDLKKEGLYRFVYPEKENQQRIVYQNNIDALLSSIAWIYSHGNSDDDKKYSEINKKILHSKIFATCGSISEWTQKILQENGIKSRIVSSLTLDQWNSYDNGHILIEVYRKKYNKWVVYDLDNNAYFSKNGIPLSLIEFSEQSLNLDYEINYISSNSNLDVANFIDNKTNYDYAFLIEARFVNKESSKQWYKRVMQVPLIGDDKYNYFFNDANISRIEKYSSYYKYMHKKQFLEKFY
jgi:hypothetical protein